jgi:hypothetical protein
MQKRLAVEIPPNAKQSAPGSKVNIKRPFELEIPPTTELFPIIDLVERHKSLLTESKVRWAVRNRIRNGLTAAGGV